MATVTQQQQSGPTTQPLQQQQPQQQLKLNPSDTNPAAQLSWEGDRMFNIYIYDYCSKRGFTKTAKELQIEADLSPDSQPPINAKQGLLFEWWSVFWVLFTTKSNGSGPEDALLYTHHQTQQTNVRQQRLQAQAQAQGGLTLHGVGQPLPPNGPPQPGAQGAPGSAAGPPMRMMNGMSRQGGPGAPSVGPGPGAPNSSFMPNGMVNGTLPNGAPAPGFGNPGMPNGIAGSPGFAGMNPQRLPQGAPGVGIGAPGQRPNGIGGPPFQQSPTMANSPNNGPGGQPGQQGPGGQGVGPMQQGQPGGGQPMNQMGPGPHGMVGTMSRPGTSGGLPGVNPNGSMLPPNSGQPGGGPQPGMNMQGQTPTPGFGRPPSRTNTPGSGGMMVQQSPSMMNRQVPGPPGQMGMGMTPGIMSPNNMGMSPGMTIGGMGINILAEFSQISLPLLKQYKSEIGIPDNNQQLSEQEKMRLVNHHRIKRQAQPGVNAAAGPSMMINRPPMQHPGQRPPGPPGPLGPQQGQRAGKRNSTSPGEEHITLAGQNDSQSSPRSAKRPRHSPMLEQSMYQSQLGQPGQPQQPGGGPNHQLGGPGGPGGTPSMNPQQPPMNMMRPNPMGGSILGGPQPMMGGGPGPSGMPGPPMGVNGAFGQGMAGGQMTNMMMSPGMHPQAGMGTPQMHNSREAQYRHNMALHKPPPGNVGSPAANAESPFNPGGPSGSGTPQFNPNRPGPGLGPQQNKPMNSMAPPPSPGMKDQNAGGPKDGNASGNGPKPGGPGGSPQNQAMGRQTPNATGTAPPTPAPVVGMNNGPPPPSTPNSNPMTAPSPSSMLSMNGGPAISSDLFSSEFINSVANTLEDFDTSIFRPDGDINFERDFGQWFNGDDAMGGGLS